MRTYRRKGKSDKRKRQTNRWRILLVFVLIAFILYSCILLKQEYETRNSTHPETVIEEEPVEFYVAQLTEERVNHIVDHTGYTVSYNKKWKIPNWVGYELTRDEVRGTLKRSGEFMHDPYVSGQPINTYDYSNSGYDRGHMAPAGDMKWNRKAMEETFFLSNICPQHPDLNQKMWEQLERKVRQWATRDSAIVVVCGPIVSDDHETIGRNRIAVPDAFFKVVLSPFIEEPKAIGFIFKNKNCTGHLKDYTVSIDSVEALTGLDFFSALPDSIEAEIEATTDTKHWNI